MTGQEEWVSWLILIGGGGLVLMGFLKVIVSSARMMVWLVLLVVGLAGMAYAIRHHPSILDAIGLPGEWSQAIQKVVLSGR